MNRVFMRQVTSSIINFHFIYIYMERQPFVGGDYPGVFFPVHSLLYTHLLCLHLLIVLFIFCFLYSLKLRIIHFHNVHLSVRCNYMFSRTFFCAGCWPSLFTVQPNHRYCYLVHVHIVSCWLIYCCHCHLRRWRRRRRRRCCHLHRARSDVTYPARPYLDCRQRNLHRDCRPVGQLNALIY